MARMDQDMPWFAALSAEDRSWVGVIVQAGIRSFVDWYRAGDEPAPAGGEMVSSVFGAAPRALAGVINLQQTVDLVRLSIEVVEANLDEMLDPADAADVGAAVLRYAREVAFATAEVYARAAEVRGAWDARLEALVVDAVLRAEADEALLSRASALGWAGRGDVAVVLGSAPRPAPRERALRRGTPGRAGRWHGRPLRRPGRPSRRRPRRRRRRRGPAPPPSSTSSGRARSSSARSPTTWGRRTSRRGPRWRPIARRPGGRRHPGRCAAPTCSPNARWPATATPAGTSSRRSTCRSSTPAGP